MDSILADLFHAALEGNDSLEFGSDREDFEFSR